MAFDESPVEVLHYNMKDLRAVEILETQLTGNVEPFLDAISALPPIRCNLRRRRRHG